MSVLNYNNSLGPATRRVPCPPISLLQRPARPHIKWDSAMLQIQNLQPAALGCDCWACFFFSLLLECHGICIQLEIIFPDVCSDIAQLISNVRQCLCHRFVDSAQEACHVGDFFRDNDPSLFQVPEVAGWPGAARTDSLPQSGCSSPT